MSCNLRAFSSLTAKRRYTLKSPALVFLKLNMYAGVATGVLIVTSLFLQFVVKYCSIHFVLDRYLSDYNVL